MQGAQVAAAKKGTKILPGMRDEPLLMQQWKYLWRDEFPSLARAR
jgi:hypothetical protein